MSLGLLLAGFIIGMQHAMEADHIAAIASLNSQHNDTKSTFNHGILWGIGHSFALLLISVIFILTGVSFSPEMSQLMEFTVGIMLLALGIDVLRRLYQKKVHFHAHAHSNGINHIHAHSHNRDEHKSHDSKTHKHEHSKPIKFFSRSLIIGIIHGMAGSAALLVLTMSSITSPIQALFYIFLFGCGSVLGMATLSIAISYPLRFSMKRLSWIYNSLHILTGVVTIVIGSSLMYDYIS